MKDLVILESKVSSNHLGGSNEPELVDFDEECNRKEENKMRYKRVVTNAHKAKDRSRFMVNRLLERATRQGDKKAVTILMDK